MAYEPRFKITAEILRRMGAIEVLHTRIQDAAIRLPVLPMIQKDVVVRSAHGSSAIEGNPLSLAEARTALEGKDVPTATRRSLQEIRNAAEAIKFIQRHCDAPSMDESDVFKIHALLARNPPLDCMKRASPLYFKSLFRRPTSGQNSAKSVDENDSSIEGLGLGAHEALDRGPIGAYRNYGVQVGHHVAPHYSEVPQYMGTLLQWVNKKGKEWPAVVSSAVLHFRFEYIHPFGDGNGRAGRALAAWELYRRKFDSHHIFAVDEILWQNRPRYYAALHNVEISRPQDLTGWISFMAEMIESTLEQTWNRLDGLGSGKEGEQIHLTPRQEKLLKLLRGGPMRPTDLQKELAVTKGGLHYVLKALLNAGLVQRGGGYKTGVYRIPDKKA